MNQQEIYVIAHDMRSTYNVGSLLRTCEGLGVKRVYLTGYTPHPKQLNDKRLPHISSKLHSQITKVSLGAEKLIDWEYQEDIFKVFDNLDSQSIDVVALEQSSIATPLNEFKTDNPVAMVLGTEVEGLPDYILSSIHRHLYIPMLGQKESFNVVQASAMALYHLRFR